jgi:L-seryl-tRNA(Ser) seleniumtransferase
MALEYDLDRGARGERLAPVVARLQRYFGAEAATVVTNNAAGLVLLLAAHAAGREVIVSRGELIEIGGSFRLPEVMAAGGARLVEVGCTNRTHLADYQAAIRDATAAILVVHRSNFHLDGFVASPDLGELVGLGRRHGVAVWVDQGSGCHLDLTAYGLRREPTVQELLAAGADAVLFSGDKLLGGPQAGIVVGSAAAIAPLRRHPLRRALRPDKSALTGLAATLDAYLAERPDEVPLYRLLATPVAELRRRARSLAARLRRAGHAVQAVPTRAVGGGGTTPDQTLPSWALELPGEDELASRLRRGTPPVITRVEAGRVLVDLRAVFAEQDGELARAVAAALD